MIHLHKSEINIKNVVDFELKTEEIVNKKEIISE